MEIMMHDANIEKLRDHFIIAGYGHMGRAGVDPLHRATSGVQAR